MQHQWRSASHHKHDISGVWGRAPRSKVVEGGALSPHYLTPLHHHLSLTHSLYSVLCVLPCSPRSAHSALRSTLLSGALHTLFLICLELVMCGHTSPWPLRHTTPCQPTTRNHLRCGLHLNHCSTPLTQTSKWVSIALPLSGLALPYPQVTQVHPRWVKLSCTCNGLSSG